MESTVMDGVVCSHCKERTANVNLHTVRPYCDNCWADINRRKSASMLAKNMKRSIETRAKMSASKKANRETEPERWAKYEAFYLEQLQRRAQLDEEVGA